MSQAVEQRSEDPFKKFIWMSIAAHGAMVLLFTALSYAPGHRIKLDEQEDDAMSVMWASTVMSPAKTAEDKLPGPEIPMPAPTKPEEAQVVAAPQPSPDSKKPTAEDDLAERKKKMREALAGLGREKDDRPVPDINNFKSIDNATSKGLPASPLGGGTSFNNSTSMIGYKKAVQKLITKNFVWIRKEFPGKSEVAFKVTAQGEILDPAIEKSSGDAAFDQAALRAVLRSSPLPSPPPDLAQDIVKEVLVVVFDPKTS